MLDALTAVGIGVAAGGAAGAFSAFLGWNSSGDPFNSKKFIGAEATGIIAGISLVFLNLAAFQSAVTDTSGLAFVELLGTIVLGTLGVDFFKTKISSMIANKEPAPVNATK